MWDIYEDSFITLTDEHGNEVDFLLLDVIEYQGQDYMALLPLSEDDDTEDETLFFLRAEKTDAGEVYSSIESIELYEAVSAAYDAYCREKLQESGIPLPDED